MKLNRLNIAMKDGKLIRPKHGGSVCAFFPVEYSIGIKFSSGDMSKCPYIDSAVFVVEFDQAMQEEDFGGSAKIFVGTLSVSEGEGLENCTVNLEKDQTSGSAAWYRIEQKEYKKNYSGTIMVRVTVDYFGGVARNEKDLIEFLTTYGNDLCKVDWL
ncbi:MAG: hypothetical protein J6T08_09000 [Lentisphaeria bacterium]|nr:hypothetical protein [Lentisphaeria bacterium]